MISGTFYPARLDGADLKRLDDFARHPTVPAPLGEALHRIGQGETRRRAYLCNEDFPVIEVGPGAIDPLGWTLRETIDSASVLHVRLRAMASHGLTAGPLVELLNQATLQLLALASVRAGQQTAEAPSGA